MEFFGIADLVLLAMDWNLGEVNALAKLHGTKLQPTDILVSLGTMPLIVGLLGARVLATALQEMGQASEEIFRGDRLPILKITPQNLETDKQSTEIDGEMD